MTGRVIGVPNYTGKQSDSVYAKMQWFIDHYDLFKLVQNNSFLYADSYATIPALTGIYKLADTGQVWQRLPNGTLVRRQALEVSPETLSAMQSLFDNVSSEWNTVYKPAISADRTAFAYQQALNNAQAAVNNNKTPATSTAAIPTTVGLYYITGQAEAGQVWERASGGTLTRRADLEAAPAAADLARRNTLLTDLTGKKQADGPQFVDGSRWVWSATGTADAGTVVAASGGGFWLREFAGSLDVRWFGAKGDGVTDDSAAITAAVGALNTRATASSNANLHFPAGIYMIKRGWLLANYAGVSGERGASILRLMSGLPARSNYLTQTAVFMGLAANGNTDTGVNKGLRISGLTFELQMPTFDNRTDAGINAMPMLGAVKLINPQSCLITDNIIRNSPSFGIQLLSTQFAITNGDFVVTAVDPAWGVRDNVVTGNYISLPTDWYVTGGAINNSSCVALSVAGIQGPRYNGCLDTQFPQDAPSTNYVVPNCENNTFSDNVFVGGSHGIYVSAANANTVSRNLVRDCSHRGIIFGYTCERNSVTANIIQDIGSTGIQFAYAAQHNTISNNTISRVGLRANISGGEYSGIKLYVGVRRNVISGNTIEGCKVGGIVVAHGAYNNVVTGNIVALGLNNAQTGTTGIDINATRLAQYTSLPFDGTTYAVGNTVSGNVVDGLEFGIMLTDEKSKVGAVTANNVTGNSIFNSKTHGISTNGRDSTVVTGNMLVGNSFKGNGFNVITALNSGGNVLIGNMATVVRNLIPVVGNSAAFAAGTTPTKAEFDALLTELRALKTALGNAL